MKYEIMMILDPSKTEKEHEKLIKEIKNIFSEGGLAFVEEDVWGIRKLAYKIKGFTSGYYTVINFEGEGEGLAKIKEELNLMSQTGLVRYLLQKMPEDYALMRYDRKEASVAKLSEHAEELQKKVTRSAVKKTEKVEEKKEEKKEVKEEKEEKTEESKEVVEKVEEKEEKVEKTEEPAKETKKTEEKEEKKEEKAKGELDAKLQAIIDDTDIDL